MTRTGFDALKLFSLPTVVFCNLAIPLIDFFPEIPLNFNEIQCNIGSHGSQGFLRDSLHVLVCVY